MSRKKNIDFHVRLDNETAELLDYLALKMNRNKTEVITLLIWASRLVEAPQVDYHEFIFQLKRIGTNLNQLVARANTTNFIDRNYCKVICDELNSLCEEIRNSFLSRRNVNVYHKMNEEKANGGNKNMAD